MSDPRMYTREEVIGREKKIRAWVEAHPNASPEDFADFCEGLD